MKKLLYIITLIGFTLLVSAVHAAPNEGPGLLINFEAGTLKPGPLTVWTNSGSLAGTFSAIGAAPEVQAFDGKNVVVFNGKNLLKSSMPAPAGISGSNDWSLEIWAFQHDLGARGSTLTSWAPRNKGAGKTAQFTWSTDGLAAIHWGADLPWKNKPSVGAWQHIVFTYSDGVESVFVNGAVNHSQPQKIDIAPRSPILIGAAQDGKSYISKFRGAIALVRIYDGVLKPELIAKKYARTKGSLPIIPSIPPSIENDLAAGIRSDSVYLNARLAASGGAETKSFVCWGLSDGGTLTGDWQHCQALGLTQVGKLTHKLTKLKAGTIYYYRMYASNSAGDSWAAATDQVTTREPRSAASQSFRIVVIPDTQNGIDMWPEVITAMSEWIAQNKQILNIKFAIHVGDIVQVGNDEDQWKQASQSFKALEGKLPYIMTPGNHDFDKVENGNGLVYFNRYFPVSMFEKHAGFGASFPTNMNNNSFHTFEAGGVQWLVIALKYNPSDTELEWANRVVASHPHHTVLVDTHSYLTHQGKDISGKRIWQKFVRKHANICAVFCGHLSTVHYDDIGDKGNKVCEMLFDWQNSSAPEMNSYCALLEIDPEARTISVECYSPWLDKFLPGPRANFGYEGITIIKQAKKSISCLPPK